MGIRKDETTEQYERRLKWAAFERFILSYQDVFWLALYIFIFFILPLFIEERHYPPLP